MYIEISCDFLHTFFCGGTSKMGLLPVGTCGPWALAPIPLGIFWICALLSV